MEETTEEWDGPWKEALECLDQVVAMFWSDVSEELDLAKGWNQPIGTFAILGDDDATWRPIGLFVCAHLETMASRGDVVARQEAKYRLLANLLGRELPEQELRRWYRLIDWIMKLPEEANRAVWLRCGSYRSQPPCLTSLMLKSLAVRRASRKAAPRGSRKAVPRGSRIP